MGIRKLRQSLFALHHKKKFILLVIITSVTIMLTLHQNKTRILDMQITLSVLKTTANDPNKYKIDHIVKNQKCKIPKMNPFHPEILPFLKAPLIEKCRIKKYGSVHNGILQLNVMNVQSVDLYYIRRVDAFQIKMSKRIPILFNKSKDLNIKYPIKEEFFKVVMVRNNKTHEEYHGSFLKTLTPNLNKKVGAKQQLNIIMIMFDSISNAHVQRSLKKSYNYLTAHPRTFIMKGQTIVGDGTTSQLCAMFTGVAERDLPEARKGFPNAKPIDDWPFIFKDMHKRNYTTLYSEEPAGAAAFHYRLKGFDKIPTTYYTRPLWLAMENWLTANGMSCQHRFNLNYINQFFEAHKENNKFAFVSNDISHNKLNRLENCDEDILNFYETLTRSGHASNTVVFLFGDHGLRSSSFRATLHGKLEERSPFLSVTLPPSFDAYPKEMGNLRRNTELMTSHFDVYATLQHLLTFPRVNEKVSNKYGKSFFTDIGKLNRTCGHAGVDKHWCTCLNYKSVNSSTDANVKKLAMQVINYINELNAKEVKGMCSVLTLRSIIRAGRRTPNTEVNQFIGTKTKGKECDSCDVQYNNANTFSRYEYEINFSVSPSGGEYEASGEMGNKGSVVSPETISRTNLYGNQPNCISKEHPHLRKYCHCKEMKR